MNPLIVGGIVEAVGKVADDLFTSDKERLDAEVELRKVQVEEQKVEAGLVQGQLDINKEEAKHSSVFVAGARPAILWIGAISMAYQFILYPLMVWLWVFMQAKGWIPMEISPPPILDTEALWVVVTGMLGIAGMRSVDKIKGVSTSVLKK